MPLPSINVRFIMPSSNVAPSAIASAKAQFKSAMTHLLITSTTPADSARTSLRICDRLRRGTLLVFMMVLSLGARSQHALSGQIADEEGVPIPALPLNLFNTTGKFYKSAQTDPQGNFIFSDIESGNYQLVVSFTGYERLEKPISVDTSVDLGILQLVQATKMLKEVTVKDVRLHGKLNEDTVSFDATAFKVARDATAGDLLEKMPTVSRDNGTIKAQNEEVKQVLVDGKPFFGTDPNLSLKNLPAEIIEKVQIFDQLSEQSQFTGVNDGNTVKTINIVTRSGMNNGQFGKLYAGYGLDNRYQSGGNVNYFNGDTRISLIGMSNNINVQNFSADDILGVLGVSSNRNRGGGGGREFRPGQGGSGDFLVPTSGGIAQTHAFGVNYSDAFGKWLRVNVSYFLNDTENDIESNSTRNYFAGEGLSQQYEESASSAPENQNHRINGRIDITLDSMNSIQLRPRFTAQSNRNAGFLQTKTSQGGDLLNASDNALNTRSDGLNFSNNLLLRHKFKKQGRTASVDWYTNTAPKNSTPRQSSLVNSIEAGNVMADTIEQQGDNRYDKNGWEVNAEYTEPLNEEHSLLFAAKYQQAREETAVYTYDVSTDPASPPVLNADLSNEFITKIPIRQYGVGYRWNLQRKLNLSARMMWQDALLERVQKFPAGESQSNRYYSLLPSFFGRYTFDAKKSLMTHFRTRAQLPGAEQLQEVLNNSNPSQLYIGNPSLKQSIQYSGGLRYNASLDKSSMFFGSVWLSLTEDYVANRIFINSRDHSIFNTLSLSPGTQLSTPQNMGQALQLRSFFTYSFPVVAIKSVLSLDLSYTYGDIPGQIDDTRLKSITHNLGGGISLSSNISEKVDFNVQFRPSFNAYENQQAKDAYVLYEGKFRFQLQMLKRMVLRTDGSYLINSSLQEGYNENIVLVNLALGVKFLKNERGEVSIGVNDLFDQNQRYVRNLNELYVEDSYTNALQRFVMASFTYNIRNFNTGKKPTFPNPTEENPGPPGMRHR